MNPYQQNYPQNNGFSNTMPQGYGNPMTGFPPMGSPAPQPGYPNVPCIQQAYPQMPQAYPQMPQACPQMPKACPQMPQACAQMPQGYPQTSAGYSNQGYTPNATQSYPSQGWPQTAATGLPQFNIQHGQQAMGGMPKPTVVPDKFFNPREDASILRKAMKGLGTDEKAIIRVLTKRTNEQRMQIAAEFRSIHGRDLIADIKSETSGNFENLLVALLTPRAKFYAMELHHAVAGVGTDEDVLIEVMCTLPSHEIEAVKQTYSSLYRRTLESDLRGDTSGNFKKLLTSLCMGRRSQDFRVDMQKVKEDVTRLLEAGKRRIGTDESVFIDIFCTRSLPHLAAVFKEYQVQDSTDIDDAIKSEFSGDIAKGLKTIARVARNMPAYFADCLHKSMKGLGTNDRQLIRIMVTRCEVDLGDIMEMFKIKYHQTLQSWIEGDCSGDYKKSLLALLG